MNSKLVIEITSLGILFFLEGLFPLFEDRKNRLAHAFPNLAMGIMNGFITSFLFAGVTTAILHWTGRHSLGLVPAVGLSGFWGGIFAFLLFDLWMYVWHVANHQVPFLWRFHRTHHSDREVDTTTALRFHTGEILFSSLLRLLVIPLLGISYVAFFLYELLLQPVILFHHSNVAVPERWDRLVRAVLVTPNMHRVHHSDRPEETNSNYSSIFSFWDRLARTFRLRPKPRAIRYGLTEFQDPVWQGFWGMVRTPFV